MGFLASSGILNRSGFFGAVAAKAFSPADVAGLSLWLKADAGVNEIGGDVSSWEDQSGGGTDATAYGTPQYISNAINGLPAIEFDGSSYMSGFNVISGTDATIFVVCKHLQYKEIGMMFEQYGDGDNFAFYRGFIDNVEQYKTRIYNGQDLSGSTDSDDGTFYIFSTTLNNTEANLYLNGTLDANGYAGDFNGDGEYYISRFQGGESNTPCTIAEVIVYDNVISENDRTDVENYLNTKYAIY